MMEERRHQPLRSPQEVGAWPLARSRFGDGARWQETETHASARCLSSEADSHQAKAPIGCGRAKPVFRRQREPGGSPRRPEKDGLASGGRWNGALRGVPVRKGSAARSRRAWKGLSLADGVLRYPARNTLIIERNGMPSTTPSAPSRTLPQTGAIRYPKWAKYHAYWL
jgi:hypothetical protein